MNKLNILKALKNINFEMYPIVNHFVVWPIFFDYSKTYFWKKIYPSVAKLIILELTFHNYMLVSDRDGKGC